MTDISKQPRAHSPSTEKWLQPLTAIFTDALRNRMFSGASLLVASSREVVYENSWGTCYAGGPPVDSATWFDLASLTKPIVVGSLLICMVSEKTCRLDDRLGDFFPAGVVPGKKRVITLRQLLNHSSGLPAYQPYYKKLIRIPQSLRAGQLLRWIFREPLISSPGTRTNYSDLGFLLLGMLIEMVLNDTLENLFNHLSTFWKGSELSYIPLATGTEPTSEARRRWPAIGQPSIAATEQCPWRKRLLMGEVHDENGYCLGGVAGHAGLFGTARAVWKWLSFLSAVYRKEIQVSGWSKSIVETFWTQTHGNRALAFDTPDPIHSGAGHRFSPRTVGHLGFTGTSFWYDIDQDIVVVLLTNRVYPSRHNDSIKQFRPLLHDTIMRLYHEA